MNALPVVDVTAANFQQLLEESADVPLLLDFWAEWCGPCKTLGPVLENLAAEYGGAFKLGKVDADKEQDLAYAFGVQGIPFCVLIVDGRPADGFQGALPEAEIRKFLEKNKIAPAEVKEAEPEVDPDSPAARVDRAIAAARAGQVAEVREVLADFPEEEEQLFDQAERLLTGLEWLEAELSPGGEDAEQALVGARELFGAGAYEPAMDKILEAVTADKTFRSGLARKAMLLCFAAVGEEDEVLDAYRRRLATLLY
ncbi:MAG: tetratricopeptide repeat protein [bacterium]|nr:tetratricopeptide repeat protein [bacterium]